MSIDSMALWSQVLDFLGFDATEQAYCKKCFWKLQPVRRRAGASAARPVGRRRAVETSSRPSSRGRSSSRFPDALQALGYEPDDRWIEHSAGEMTKAN